MVSDMKSTRSYTMTARAEAVAETRRRILEATWSLAGEVLLPQISLESVATRAGVSVQTVLRQFGSRADLLAATQEHAAQVVAAERRPTGTDRSEAIHLLVDHYERRGDAVLLLLAQEAVDPSVRRITESGRRLHRAWVREVFATWLADAGAGADRLEDLLVVATDIYVWKLLRRDQALSRTRTEEHIEHLVDAVLAAPARRGRRHGPSRAGATDG